LRKWRRLGDETRSMSLAERAVSTSKRRSPMRREFI
jgi:hypothetical protein